MPVELATFPTVTVVSGGTAVPITSTPIFVKSITIQANFTNAGKICVGDSTVTTSTGIEIPPGDTATIEGPSSGRGTEEFLLNEVYVVSSTSNDECRVIGFKRSP